MSSHISAFRCISEWLELSCCFGLTQYVLDRAPSACQACLWGFFSLTASGNRKVYEVVCCLKVKRYKKRKWGKKYWAALYYCRVRLKMLITLQHDTIANDFIVCELSNILSRIGWLFMIEWYIKRNKPKMGK